VNPLESRASSHPIVEPLDDWVLVQPSMEEEAIGRIVLPANMTEGRLERSIVLAVGSEISDLHPGDIVLMVSAKSVELRDGSKLVRRQHAVARIRE
jgi:co-chaperonin GroES (HSP10)